MPGVSQFGGVSVFFWGELWGELWGVLLCFIVFFCGFMCVFLESNEFGGEFCIDFGLIF